MARPRIKPKAAPNPSTLLPGEYHVPPAAKPGVYTTKDFLNGEPPPADVSPPIDPAQVIAKAIKDRK
jgi:hypothetical protein